MTDWVRPGIYGALLSSFLLFLLPSTSSLLLNLYHSLSFEPLYYLYAAIKAASAYYPRWDYFEISAIAAGLFLTFSLWLWKYNKTG